MNLHYLKPAQAWVEALPLGNGRLGAMVFGGVAQERLALNEDTLWSGYPSSHLIPNASEHIRHAAKLILEGRHMEAEEEIEDHILGEFSESYEPLGDLWLDFPALEGKTAESYYRELNLRTGIAMTRFSVDGVRYNRTSFVSHPHQALIVRMEADARVLTAKLHMTSPLRHQIQASNSEIVMTTRCPSCALPSYYDCGPNAVTYDDTPEKQGVSAATILQVDTDGTVQARNDCLMVDHATWFEIRVVCRSNFEGFNHFPGLSKADYLANARADLDAAVRLSYQQLMKEHLQDFTPQMELQSIAVEGEAYENLPTDERLRRYTRGGEDISLPILLYQYGRYLLLSGSRPGTRAMNLQGIWNDMVQPPWSCNYTTNINAEMNYWPAEITGLPGIHEPLFNLMDALSVTGAEVAKAYFGARGATTNHNTDIWAHATPVGNHGRDTVNHSWWPMAYGWLSGHLFEHYIYTDDREFLKNRALPILRNAALFFIDAVQEIAPGVKSMIPSTSPENRFRLGEHHIAACSTATVNEEIIRQVLTDYLAALDILGLEEEDQSSARELLEKLPPIRIGEDGRLLEWDQEYEESDPQHRHISHLCGLFPGHLRSPRKDSRITDAIKKSLVVRGDDGTGWSLGWKVNLWARLGDGDHAMLLLRRQLRMVDTDAKENYSNGGGSYANLFCAHPPFQIDGNFAASSGVPRLLMDTDLDEIALLPALPSSWKNVEGKGLCGANGYRVDLKVENGKLVFLRLISGSDRATRIRLGEKEIILTLKKGETLENPAALMI